MDSESEDHAVGEVSDEQSGGEDGDDSSDDEGTNGSSVSGDDGPLRLDGDDSDSMTAEDGEKGAPWVENIICKRTVWRRIDSEGRLVCFLCKRRFRSDDHARRHESNSKLHNQNVEETFDSVKTMMSSLRAQHLALLQCELPGQRRQHRSVPPEKKKQRTAKVSLLDGVPDEADSTDATDDGSLSSLGADLTARIASFASFRTGLMDFCVAVGPMNATAIRHYYLHGNYGFLQHNLTLYVSGVMAGWRCRKNITTWMKANKEWKKLCTPENIDKFSTVTSQDETTGALTSNVDPAVLFNNPAVAVELNLDEVLEFLVKQDGVDVNGYNFNSYSMLSRPHLSALALSAEAEEALQVLLSVEEIFWDPPVYDPDRFPSCDKLFKFACKSHLGCFILLVRSTKFHVNQPLDDGPFYLLPLLIVLRGLMKVDEVDRDELDLWWCRFRELIKAGADPRLSADDHSSPLDAAKHWRDYLSADVHEQNFKTLNEAIELMERLAKMLDEC
mmetsp:Transcript_6546/g.14366  ORF Transcript_6546/g.14366 Transcript_6546/m.14366 type:complete len:502 (-) Transcript_6546:158-1663(-)